MFENVVTFAFLVAICENDTPFFERSTLNLVSLLELSVQDRLIWLDDTAVAVRFVGATGVAVGFGLGVGVEVGVGVDVGVGGAVGVEVALGVGVGVGGGVPSLIWTIGATEGTPLELRMNSM
jgi:hypothetical protein